VDFVALDVETANPRMASICQLGIAKYSDGRLVDEWKSLVDPEDFFDQMNMRIHGIGESTILGAPKFPDVYSELCSFLSGAIVVSHTSFDRAAIMQSCEKYGIDPPQCNWLDSARVARRTWSECAYGGYGLNSVSKIIGYEFNHHDALEDAKASAQVVIAAINETGISLEDWLERAKKPIASSSSDRIKLQGNPEGELFGEVLVFTGAVGMPRKVAAEMAASAGCEVAAGVTKKTTIVVVGDQDIKALAGHEKSSKHRKAEELIEKGFSIRILSAPDFGKLIEMSSSE
jgi:DNA polymerase III subunit epsilon